MIDFFTSIGGAIMTPLYYAISFVLVGFHNVFGGLFGQTSGLAWVLSIIGLTLVVRAALIPLFVKQIKSSRNMQLIQPKVRELQKKYGHDRERLAQETMKLYKDSGTNPFASCLPILLQMPIFLALFRILDQAARNPEKKRGLMTPELNEQLHVQSGIRQPVGRKGAARPVGRAVPLLQPIAEQSLAFVHTALKVSDRVQLREIDAEGDE